MSEMQSFNTKLVRHEFLVDDVPYFIAGVNVGDLEEIDRLARLDGKDQIAGFREFMVSRIHKTRFWSRSGRWAARKLNAKQLSELFRTWSQMGKTPGESSASPDSA